MAFSDELAYVRHRGSESVLMIPLKTVGEPGRPVPVVDFPGGQHPPGRMPRPTPAAGIVQAPGAAAVLVANPEDQVIYFYKEGMAAPMGHFKNYGKQPRAALVVDRSLREVQPGVYQTTAKMAGPPATTSWPSSWTPPSSSSCFPVKVAEDPVLAAARQPQLGVEPVGVPSKVTVAGDVARPLQDHRPGERRAADRSPGRARAHLPRAGNEAAAAVGRRDRAGHLRDPLQAGRVRHLLRLPGGRIRRPAVPEIAVPGPVGRVAEEPGVEWRLQAMKSLALLLGLSLLLVAAPAPADPPEKTLDGITVPDVKLVDQDGRPVRFYTDLVKGQVVAMNFVFTSCGTICPPMGANFAKLQKILGGRPGPHVRLISVSIDPANDTPERLKAWAAKFGAQPGLDPGHRRPRGGQPPAQGPGRLQREPHRPHAARARRATTPATAGPAPTAWLRRPSSPS